MSYSETDRNNDFKWFIDNYKKLYEKYGRKILVIQKKKIIGVFDDKNTAIDTIAQKHELGSFIVQECNGNESGYTNYITSWELIK